MLDCRTRNPKGIIYNSSPAANLTIVDPVIDAQTSASKRIHIPGSDEEGIARG